MALAALVSGSQAQARSYRQGEGGVVDGSKGESLSIILKGGMIPICCLIWSAPFR